MNALLKFNELENKQLVGAKSVTGIEPLMVGRRAECAQNFERALSAEPRDFSQALLQHGDSFVLPPKELFQGLPKTPLGFFCVFYRQAMGCTVHRVRVKWMSPTDAHALRCFSPAASPSALID